MYKMDLYGIEIIEVEATIKQGMKWKEKKDEKWHSRMMGIETVFTIEDNKIFVITVYPAGGKK